MTERLRVVGGQRALHGELQEIHARTTLEQAEDGSQADLALVIGSMRFVVSTRDLCVHIVTSAGEHSAEVLTARCGHTLPTGVTPYDQPPSGPPCEARGQLFVESFTNRRGAGSNRSTDGCARVR